MSFDFSTVDMSVHSDRAASVQHLKNLKDRISRARLWKTDNERRLRRLNAPSLGHVHRMNRRASAMSMGHLIDRYIMVLLQEIFKTEMLLGQRTVPHPRIWEFWRAAEAALEARSPNIHDLFLLQTEGQGVLDDVVLLRDAQ